MTNIPDTIRTARLNAGLTQKELGELLGYKPKSGEVTVGRWEAGVKPIPQRLIRPLAAILRIELSRLVP